MSEPRKTAAPADKPAADDSAPAPNDDTAAGPPRDPGAVAGFGPPSEPGDVGTLGTYRIVRKIGQGNMGAVYQAIDRRIGRRLAIKVMIPEAAAEADARERFLREARAAALLEHDNVVTVYEADERDGVPYIAMQLLQGQTLDDFLKAGGKFDVRQILRIAREAASALAAAHATGIIHRDIKPANLWVEVSGRTKVLDFGLVKPIGAEADLTRTGVLLGTPRYMSPEQARGKDIDHRTDLFSLGAVLYLLCTGVPAFDGPHAMAVLTALIADDPAPICKANPAIPAAFADVVHKLLEKKAAHRVQSAQEVVACADAALYALDAPAPPPVSVPPPIPAPPPPAAVVPPLIPPVAAVVATSSPPVTSGDLLVVSPPALPTVGRAFLLGRASASGGLRAVWDEAVEAALQEDWARWELCWDVVREVGARADLAKGFKKMVAGETRKGLLKLPLTARARLRAACDAAGLPAPRPLLVPVGPDELEPLLTGPPDNAGYTAFAVLSVDTFNWLGHIRLPADRVKMRHQTREFMLAAPPPVVAAYFFAARPHLAADPGIIDILFGAHSPAAAALLDRLLVAGVMKPTDWKNLCASGRMWSDEWGAFLLENDRLANLLTGLGGTGTGADIWAAYVGLLTPALISPDLVSADGQDWTGVHEWERRLHRHLKLAGERLVAAGLRLAAALHAADGERLLAANNLLKWLGDPASAEPDGYDEVQRACRVFAVDRLEFVRLAYRRGRFDQLELPKQLAPLEPLMALFRAAFRPDGTLESARFAVAQWVNLSQDCPKALRADFQAHFVLTCVFHGHYATLLQESGAPAFEPEAIEIVRRTFAPAKKRRG